MTAQPTAHDDSQVDARISSTVEGLRVYKHIPKTRIYQAMHVSRTAYYARLSGETRWTAADVKRAADALGVSVATLYDGLLPHLDSNQKPTGLRAARPYLRLAS